MLSDEGERLLRIKVRMLAIHRKLVGMRNMGSCKSVTVKDGKPKTRLYAMIPTDRLLDLWQDINAIMEDL